jgi:hypothetical protein
LNPLWQLAGTAAIQIAGVAFIWGALTEKVKGQGREIGEIKGVQKEHGLILVNHERRISHSEGRKGIPLEDA